MLADQSILRHRATVAAIFLAVLSAPLAAAPPTNDNCATPTAISGSGTFSFDLTQATTGTEGQNNIFCPAGGNPAYANDVWFCWTADCSGLALVTTCGLTNVDTKISFYTHGCACPTQANSPLCCSDDSCGLQSTFTCETVCGQQYLIQIGCKPGSPPGAGQFSITCSGNPCPPPPTCATCCEKKPLFASNSAFANFPGRVAVATTEGGVFSASPYVLHMIDIDAPVINSPPANWFANFYEHPTWTRANLGTIFATTFDDQGNIYVAHSSSYGFPGGSGWNPTDAVGPGGPGAIYKISTTTAVPAVFAVLPNLLDANTALNCYNAVPASERYPGLGDVTFDCTYQRFYVSNFENGKIYSLDTSGATMAVYDHGTPDNGVPGFVPLGDRVWAVATSKGRLYYSIWDAVGLPNQIWSIALAANGNFIAGSQQLEISYAPYANYIMDPVSDISFAPDCCMLVAERSMSCDTESHAHQSRALEFCYDAAQRKWTPSANLFKVGVFTQTNSAGGCAWDFSSNGRVWVSGDALLFGADINYPLNTEYIYGLQGFPMTGGDTNNSALIDMDQDVTAGDKFQLGDVQVPCPTPPLPPPQPPTCGPCCEKKPHFAGDTTHAGFPGRVAVATTEGGIFANTPYVVHLIDIDTPVINSPPANWYANFYNDATWIDTVLGTVFAATIDDVGNVYVAHTAIYGQPGASGSFNFDKLGTGGAGAIYRLDTNTGLPSVFAVLPNVQDPNIAVNCSSSPLPSESYPGLGDVFFDCGHKRFYVSNFEDGKIYSLDAAGSVQSVYDHGTPDNGLPGFVPLGDRVWAVAVAGNRCYYSIWSAVNTPNVIWSVGLDGAGNFVAGSAAIELSFNPINTFVNTPVSDIVFSPECCMLVAERSMQCDTESSAHSSRALEFCWDALVGGWAPSPNLFKVGVFSQTNSAGGAAWDYSSNGRVWVTGDALLFGPDINYPLNTEYVYGMQGFPMTGGDTNNSALVDLDQNVAGSDKFQLGDVEVPCPAPPLPPCQPDPQGTGCTGGCPNGMPCVPVEITLGLDGVYRVTKCDCVATCHVEMGPAGPICVNACPIPGLNCQLKARGNIDGTITFSCMCIDFTLPVCEVGSICNPNQPGSCYHGCVGVCPPGEACFPVEITENPAGSGHYEVTDCDCMPIFNTPCHPVVINGLPQCIGGCSSGAPCKLVATWVPPDPTLPNQTNPTIKYRCQCICTPPPANMVGWWPLDENPATLARDFAGFPNNGTPAGSPGPTPVAGCVSGAYSFDGIDDAVIVPNHASLNFGPNNFSIDAWVRTTASNGIQSIVDKRVPTATGSAIGYSLFLFNGMLACQIADSSGHSNFISTLNVADGNCHHVAVTVIRGLAAGGQLYVDGVAQAFNPTGRPGSLNNNAVLSIGRHSISPVYFSGIIDEVEIFNRALTAAQVTAIYNVGAAGKCRDACYLPNVVFCPNDLVRPVSFTICNYNAVGALYNWTIAGSVGGAGCTNLGLTTITPNSGSVFVPAGGCVNVNVTMVRPPLLPFGAPVTCGCYQLSVTNTGTGNTFGCTSTICNQYKWCYKIIDTGVVHAARVGVPRQFQITVCNLNDPIGLLDYQLVVHMPDHGDRDGQSIRLNGLPPGVPVIGTLSVTPGGMATIDVGATFDEDVGPGVYEIMLEADTDGDGVPEPVNAIALRSVVGCATETTGDIDGDGFTTANDVPRFVRALLGDPVDAYDLVTSDVNCDNAADGEDISTFVNALITGP